MLFSFSGPKFASFWERSEGLVFWRCVEKGRLCRKLSRGTQRENDSFWVAVDYGVVSGERGFLPPLPFSPQILRMVGCWGGCLGPLFPPPPPLSLSMGGLKVSTRFFMGPPSRVGADGRSRSGLGWFPLPLYRSRWSGFFPFGRGGRNSGLALVQF